MARVPYILDGRTFAVKIKHSTELLNWRSDVSICCPNCSFEIDNSYMQQDWPGFPLGVKFDPTDQELLKHLQAKSGCGNERLHPFIDEFISTLDGNNGICYTHPEKLPGVTKDGSCIHFFHKTVKAYATGTRKRRKIQKNEDDPYAEDVRWHKTGKTMAILDNGEQIGWKKRMVLYVTPGKGMKAKKTNWKMHQYHLGTEEDEKDNEYVISKVFFQHQAKQEEVESSKPGPLTPSSATPPPSPLKQNACPGDEKEHDWLLSSMFCDEHLPPDTVKYGSPLGVGDHITESSKEQEMFSTSLPTPVKLNSSANESGEQNLLHPTNSEVAEAGSEKQHLEPNEEGDSFSESFLPDISLDLQRLGESELFADSQELLDTLFCAETLNVTHNQETMEEEQGVAPWPEGGRVIADADEGRAPASPKQNVTTFPEEGHVIGGGDNIQDVPRPESPFSSQASLSGWINKIFNFSENDSQGVMDDNIMEDGQFI